MAGKTFSLTEEKTPLTGKNVKREGTAKKRVSPKREDREKGLREREELKVQLPQRHLGMEGQQDTFKKKKRQKKGAMENKEMSSCQKG